MADIEEILKLADDCYRHASATANPATRQELTNMGDEYLKTAEMMQRER
jgi:hypothetical protein